MLAFACIETAPKTFPFHYWSRLYMVILSSRVVGDHFMTLKVRWVDVQFWAKIKGKSPFLNVWSTIEKKMKSSVQEKNENERKWWKINWKKRKTEKEKQKKKKKKELEEEEERGEPCYNRCQWRSNGCIWNKEYHMDRKKEGRIGMEKKEEERGRRRGGQRGRRGRRLHNW